MRAHLSAYALACFIVAPVTLDADPKVPGKNAIDSREPERVPNPKYPRALKEFNEDCGPLNQEHVASLRRMVQSMRDLGAVKGAASREARQWCREREISDEYHHCVAAIVRVEYTPEYELKRAPLPEPTPEVRRYLEYAKQQRLQHIAKLRETKASWKKAMNRIRRQPDNRRHIARYKKKLAELTQQLRDLQRKDAPYTPKIEQLALGSVGVLHKRTVEVLQVLDSRSALAQLSVVVPCSTVTGQRVSTGSFRLAPALEAGSAAAQRAIWRAMQQAESSQADCTRKETVCLANLSTAGWVDGAQIDVPQVFAVVETKTYVTEFGGTNTVFVLEPIDPEIVQLAEDYQRQGHRRP